MADVCLHIHVVVYEFLYIKNCSKNLTMERKILELFLYSDKLRFSEIEKGVGVRSNKLDYHLKKLVAKGVLVCVDGCYELSESSEYLIPYVSDKRHVLSVILVHVGDSTNAFLIEREKRPYKGKLGLPGGRMIVGESISEGAERILKKFGVSGKFERIGSVSLEHLKKGKEIVASYLLVHVFAVADCDLVDLKKNKGRIIESDYLLMKNGSSDGIAIRQIDSDA